jgi:hypothetical protein
MSRATLTDEHYAFRPEFAGVRAALYARVQSVDCVCGGLKRFQVPFCEECCRKLGRVDERFEWWTRRRLANGPDELGLWLFDVCVDLLADPNLGSWTPPRRKKESD